MEKVGGDGRASLAVKEIGGSVMVQSGGPEDLIMDLAFRPYSRKLARLP